MPNETLSIGEERPGEMKTERKAERVENGKNQEKERKVKESKKGGRSRD